MQRHRPVVGAVYVCVEELKKYGAYQILEVLKGSICYIALDYLEVKRLRSVEWLKEKRDEWQTW